MKFLMSSRAGGIQVGLIELQIVTSYLQRRARSSNFEALPTVKMIDGRKKSTAGIREDVYTTNGMR